MVKQHTHVLVCMELRREMNGEAYLYMRVLLTHTERMALYLSACLFPPSATAAKACEMFLASLSISLTLPAASCEHTCMFMSCNINMTIYSLCSHAGGWRYRSGQYQMGGASSSHAGTAVADEVQM